MAGARATDACARSAIRRSLLTLAIACYFAGATLTHDGRTRCVWCSAESAGGGAAASEAPADPRFEPGACAALLDSLAASPAELLDEMGDEMRSHTPQGALSPATLLVQIAVATAAVYIAVDDPQGTGGALWSAAD